MRSAFDGSVTAGFSQAGTVLEKGLAGAIGKGSAGFDGLRKAALAALNDIAAQSMRGPSAGSSNGGGAPGAGGLLGPLLGLPGRATGGPVSPGGAYVVGERGPELFVPSTAGRIDRRHRFRAGAPPRATCGSRSASQRRRPAPSPAGARPVEPAGRARRAPRAGAGWSAEARWWLAGTPTRAQQAQGDRLDQAFRSEVLDGQFPAPDDGGGDDDRARRAARRCGLLPDERPRRADLGGRGHDRSSAAALRDGARLSRVHAGLPLALVRPDRRSMRSTARR